MDWNIQPRAKTCLDCGKQFADKEELHTLLKESRHGYERTDVCGACFESGHKSKLTGTKELFSHWQTIHTVPPPGAPEVIQKGTAEEILRRLVELNDPQYAGSCFVLAIMLERKRQLRVKATRQVNGKRVLLYEQAKTGDLFNIEDPELKLDQLEAVNRQVADLLEQGLPAPAALPAAPIGAVETPVEAGDGEPPAESAPIQTPDPAPAGA